MSNQFQEKTAQATQGGGFARIQAQHDRGKLTARERIEALVDRGSFFELDQLVTAYDGKKESYTDGVITGLATVDGRRIALYAQDFTMQGGSVGKHHAAKICKIMEDFQK